MFSLSFGLIVVGVVNNKEQHLSCDFPSWGEIYGFKFSVHGVVSRGRGCIHCQLHTARQRSLLHKGRSLSSGR